MVLKTTLKASVVLFIFAYMNTYAAILTPSPSTKVIYSCPEIPPKFKINETFKTKDPFANWILVSEGTNKIQEGSEVTLELEQGDTLVTVTSGKEFTTFKGTTIECYGKFKINYTEYEVKIYSPVSYEKCKYIGNAQFECTGPVLSPVNN